MSRHERLEREMAIAAGRAWLAATPDATMHSGRVAGVWYFNAAFDHGANRAHDGARRGDILAAIREPDNPHDDNAIGLWTGLAQLGHVPTVLAAKVAQEVEAGRGIWAIVTGEAACDNPTGLAVAYFGPAIAELMAREKLR